MHGQNASGVFDVVVVVVVVVVVAVFFYSWVSRPISTVFFLSTYKYNSFTNKNTILWLVGRGLLVKPPGNRKKRRDVIIMVRGTLD